MRKGTAGWTPGVDIFPPIEFATAAFVGKNNLCMQTTLLAILLGGG